MGTKYALVCSAAGTGFGECLPHIGAYGSIATSGTKVISLGDSLGADYRALMSSSMPDIFRRVRAGMHDALQEVSDHDGFSVVGCHLTLYDKRTQVFHAPFDASVFIDEGNGVAPDRVILLIDDIYDMIGRLNGSGDIFDAAASAQTALTELASAASRGDDVEITIGDRERALARLDAETGSLHRLLAWRRAEMVAAEGLANTLDVPLYLLGVKHPLEVAELALAGDGPPPPTYISHPITRHRVDQRTRGTWSADVTSLNRLPLELSRHGVVAVMPTAIDELRFAAPASTDLFMRTAASTARWPCMASDHGLISPSYEPEKTDHRGIESTAAFEFDAPVASAYTRSLESAIYWEIPFRDHYIVNHCPGLFVFRPQESGNAFSGGVRAEIEFFERRAESEDRRMVVVHDIEDVTAILDRIGNGTIVDHDIARRTATAYLMLEGAKRIHHDVTAAEASTIFRSGLGVTSMLNASTSSDEALVEFTADAWISACEVLIYAELTGLGQPRNWSRVVIGNTSGTAVISESCDWLRARSDEDVTSLMTQELVSRLGKDEYIQAVGKIAGAVAVSIGIQSSPVDVVERLSQSVA